MNIHEISSMNFQWMMDENMNFHGIRFIMKLWLLERTSLVYGHTWTSWSSIMSQTSLYLLLEQKEREGRKGARGGETRAASEKNKSGALWFFGAKVLVHGKRFGQWAAEKKIVGSLKLISFRSVHRVKWTGQFDNVAMVMWSWPHGNVDLATWTWQLGTMDFVMWQSGLDNWALRTLWCGKVDLPTWTWQLGTRDFVIWQSGLGTMDLTIGCFRLCDLAKWTWQMSIPYLCFGYLYSWMF